jgi:hypothetical protein
MKNKKSQNPHQTKHCGMCTIYEARTLTQTRHGDTDDNLEK